MIEMKTAFPRPLRRLGVVMEPDPADLREAEGVLNPAVARGPDGQLYLLPRLVAPATTPASAWRGSSSTGTTPRSASSAWAWPSSHRSPMS